MSPASLDELLARYAELDALLARAITACQTQDRDQAVLLAFAVTQKLTTLDERLLEMGILPEGETWPVRRAAHDHKKGRDGVQVPSDL